MLRSEKKFLLGIDIGTSACKAAVFDLEGRVVAQSTKSYNVYYPAPGWVEQDPGEWWAGVCGVVKETLDQGKKIRHILPESALTGRAGLPHLLHP